MRSLVRRRSTAYAAAAAIVGSLLCWAAYRLPPPTTSDLDQLLIAARALFAGKDPYAVVAHSQYYPLYYPLPAVLLVAPLAVLPTEWARVVWAGIGAAVFSLAAMRYGRGLAVGMLSASFLHALVLNQWSPILTAGAVIPWLGLFWVAKPSVGTAMLAAYPSRGALLGSALLLLSSFLVEPEWPARWYDALRSSQHASPILQPGGIILLLAVLRWRRPEARLLLGLACVPQTIGLYETLPLFLIPRTRRPAYVLAVLTYVAAFAQAIVFPRLPGMSLEQNLANRWPVILGLVYVPALVILFLQPAAASELTDRPDTTSPWQEHSPR
jgi:hypothetical protein